MSQQPVLPLFITMVKTTTAHTASCLLRLHTNQMHMVKSSPSMSVVTPNNLHRLRHQPSLSLSFFFCFNQFFHHTFTPPCQITTFSRIHALQVSLLFDSLSSGWAYKYISTLKSSKSCFRMVPLTRFLQIMVSTIKHLFLKDMKLH